MNYSIETYEAQNSLASISKNIHLNVAAPSSVMKKQFHKAKLAIETARHELDLLNDLKEKL